VHERSVGRAFAGKYAASLTTSIHWHDNCAHDYLRAVSEDLGMLFAGSHSPEMHDLLEEKGQRQLLAFGRHVLRYVSEKLPLQRTFQPLVRREWTYEPGLSGETANTAGRRVIILHDATKDQPRLHAMVRQLEHSFLGATETVNLRELDIKGNCTGCLSCAAAYRCKYEGKDGFIEFYNRVLRPADLLIFAGCVVDRHLSSRWRQFFERAFFNTHTPSLVGKQLAFVISGPLGQMANLREILVGYAQWQEANLVDVISDELPDGLALDRQLSGLARRMVAAAEDSYVRELDFLGAGGRKIFRDHIFGPLRFVFLADHGHYTRTGVYDFPTRQWAVRLRNWLLLLLFRLPPIRRAFERDLKRGMIRPFERVVGSSQNMNTLTAKTLSKRAPKSGT
jgi:hypothetical protein